MRAIIGLAAVLVLAACAGPAPPPSFDLQGHRGARGLWPENTLPAFDGALALGVTTLEMDTGVTRDGVVVVSHDRRLNPDRTRRADGSWIGNPSPTLSSLSYDEVRAFDVGRPRPGGASAKRFPEQRAVDGVPMPRLAEVLARAEARSGGTMRYNIETKLSPVAPDETVAPEPFARALVAVLAGAGLDRSDRAAVQSFDWRTLEVVRRIAPAIPTVCLTAEQDWSDTVGRGQPGPSPWTAGRDVDDFAGSVPHMVRAAGCAVWSPYYEDLDASSLSEAEAMDLKVVVWTVNEPEDMQRLISLGVDGIITDYPDRLRAVMAARGMPLPPAFPAGG